MYDRSWFRDRRPRLFLVRSRVGVCRTVRLDPRARQYAARPDSGTADGRAHGGTGPGTPVPGVRMHRRARRPAPATGPWSTRATLRVCHASAPRRSPCSGCSRSRLSVPAAEPRGIVRCQRSVYCGRPCRGRLPRARDHDPVALHGRAPERSTPAGTARPRSSAASPMPGSRRSATPAGRGRSEPSERPCWPCSRRPD